MVKSVLTWPKQNIFVEFQRRHFKLIFDGGIISLSANQLASDLSKTIQNRIIFVSFAFAIDPNA